MLRELHISNLAVIEDARIELAAGLNCFTGATGAGKSLVIGAIEILLGLRSPSEMLRSGADEGRVSGVFEIREKSLLDTIERVTDVPVREDGGDVLITRRLYASGRTSVSLNGHPITLAMLKAVSETLVDVHGQHDHQYLLKAGNQLETLDTYAGLLELRGKYREVFNQLQQAQQRLDELAASTTLRKQQLELYRFQGNEIDAGELSEGEYEELSARMSVLQNLEKLKKDAGMTYAALYEADGAILERLKMMAAVLSELKELDQSISPAANSVRDATLQLEDAAFEIGRYIDRLDLDPGELAEVSERLNVINRLLNKYGDSVELILKHREELRGQINELEQAGDDQTALRAKLAPLKAELKKLGDELSAKRKSAAAEIAPRIETHIADLGMEKARFKVDVRPAAPSPSGADEIEFLAQTNPGLQPQPLRKIASGGELSRLMLALKSVLAQGDRVSVLVFDEIDSNVGGRLGAIIGNRLRQLAKHHQVLCITHLPQIAAYADRHLNVSKQVEGAKTVTRVKMMEGDARIEELAEMIGGHTITATTRAQARELIEAAQPSAATSTPTRKKSRVAG